MDKEEAKALWLAAATIYSMKNKTDDAIVEGVKSWGIINANESHLKIAMLFGVIYEHLTDSDFIGENLDKCGTRQAEKILFDDSLSRDQKSIQLYECVARAYRFGYYGALSEGRWVKSDIKKCRQACGAPDAGKVLTDSKL